MRREKMLKKHAASLMIIMTLILCGISSAAAVSELEAALRSDHTWDEYEITARAGDYAVISSKDRNLLVTMVTGACSCCRCMAIRDFS